MITTKGGAPHAGLGSEMFISASSLASGTITPPQGTAHTEEDIENDDGDNASTSSSVSSVVVALATATLTDSSWQFPPSYPPQYLSTISEYLPPPKQPPTMSTAGAAVDDGDTQKGHPWATEKYENSMRTDHVFDRFVERAAHEPQQCVRYDLGGIPLPFASDHLYKQLFPSSLDNPEFSTTVTKAEFNVRPQAPTRWYGETSIPACPHCGSRRIFEFQLMPNLINILSESFNTSTEVVTATEEQRKAEVEGLLKGNPDGRGMEWGTVLVFSCEKDCRLGPGNKEKQDAWNEELVLVHWDD